MKKERGSISPISKSRDGKTSSKRGGNTEMTESKNLRRMKVDHNEQVS